MKKNALAEIENRYGARMSMIPFGDFFEVDAFFIAFALFSVYKLTGNVTYKVWLSCLATGLFFPTVALLLFWLAGGYSPVIFYLYRFLSPFFFSAIVYERVAQYDRDYKERVLRAFLIYTQKTHRPITRLMTGAIKRVNYKE